MGVETPANLASTTLGSSLTTTGTTTATLINATAEGFTNNQYHVLMMNGATVAASTQFEIALASGLSGNTLTLSARAVEPVAGTQTAYEFASGSTIMVVSSVQSVQDMISQATIPATQIPNVVILVANSAVPTFDTDMGTIFRLLGLSQNIASWTTNWSGTPIHGQVISFEITDNGTGRTMAWGAKFTSPNSGVVWPTSTTANVIKRAEGIYNSATFSFDCIRVV